MKAKTSCTLKLTKEEVDLVYRCLRRAYEEREAFEYVLDRNEADFIERLADTIFDNEVKITASILHENRFVDY